MSDGRIICVGDLHGCLDELIELLDKCNYNKKKDRLIFVGDLIDRGPYPMECVDFVMNNAECVMGNHEERIIRYYDKWLKENKPIDPEVIDEIAGFRSPEHRRSFHSLKPKHFEWMRTLPLFIRLAEHNAVVVHAGCLPEVPLERQDPFMLMHVSCIKPPYVGYKEGSNRISHGYWSPLVQSWWPSKAPEGAKFWACHYGGDFGTVIFGHSGFDEPAIFPHAIGIDTGCPFGRSLTALILPDWTFVSVPARKVYKESKNRPFEIYPGIFVYS